MNYRHEYAVYYIASIFTPYFVKFALVRDSQLNGLHEPSAFCPQPHQHLVIFTMCVTSC